MNFKWEKKREHILRGVKISAEKKLEGIRLMNELTDKILGMRQKVARRKLREMG